MSKELVIDFDELIDRRENFERTFIRKETMSKSIAVIGCGFVGGNLARVFYEKGFDVYAFDKGGRYPEGINSRMGATNTSWPQNIDELVVCVEQNISNFSGIYFVALPTPMKPDGSCDLSIVESVLTELANIPGERIAVVKSTVPPGSTEAWNAMFNAQGLTVHHSPEFLREATALEDMRNQDRIIIGGPRPQIDKVRDVFRAAFPDVPIHKTSSSNSECIKYFINTFLALKVSFANEFHQLVEKLQTTRGLDVDYDRVIDLVTLDSRIGTSHLQVPGPMPADDGSSRLLPGYSGSCFIKDTNAIISLMRDLGVDPKVLEGGWQKNLEVRPERDWERLEGRAVSIKNEKT